MYQKITRAEALKQGLTHYFTGKPCKRGHVAKRRVCDWCCDECSKESHQQKSRDPIEVMRSQYRTQKHGAFKRGIEWQLTFDQWRDWWLATGHYHERGHCKGQYVMARYGDVGPYSLDNIYCNTAEGNTREGAVKINTERKNAGWHHPHKGLNREQIRVRLPNKPRDKSIANKPNDSRKPYHSPNGDFESIGAAIKASGVSAPTFRQRAKADPANYYYL